MPAKSKAQQSAAGIARAYQKGEIPASKLKGPAKEMAKMKPGDLRKFAKTKRKGLPQKVAKESETLESKIDKALFESELATGRN